jgi:hypothetical protein
VRINIRNRKATITIIALCSLLFIPPVQAMEEEIEVVNRPVNTSGLTGLLITTSPYTLPPRVIEIGLSVLSETSISPDYTIEEFPLSVSVGMSENSEFGLKCSYYSITEGPTGTQVVTRETGNIELAYKLNIVRHQEDSLIPGFSIIIAGKIPTEDTGDALTSSVSNWGARLGIAAGSEIGWKNHVLGIYADGQLVGQDLNNKPLKDTSWMFNAGLIFTLSKYQNLQMFIEYSSITGVDLASISGGNSTTFTSGLRVVTERFNLTVGNQSLNKQMAGFDDSGRVIGLISRKF